MTWQSHGHMPTETIKLPQSFKILLWGETWSLLDLDDLARASESALVKNAPPSSRWSPGNNIK